MSEMIERVARAMFESDVGVAGYAPGFLWDRLPDRNEWRRRARVAIAAMREPTLAMANAPYERIDEIPKTDPPLYPLAYQKMIDAALKD